MKEHRYLFLLMAAVTIVQIIFGIAIYTIFEDWDKSGTFGDTFGAINSLFSALAFSALIYTIILQSRELKLQREELSLTRDQLADSARSQRDQAKYMLLSTQISAAISKQEIYANHYVNQKQFPDHELHNLGEMRSHLKMLMDATDSLVSDAAKRTST
jgi:hypothetical protein